MVVDFDMIIPANRALLPFAKRVGIYRQSRQVGGFQIVKQLLAACTKMTAGAIVQIDQAFTNGVVQLSQRQETALA